MNTKAISIISKDLKFEWIYFLQNFQNYDLFIVIDDNIIDYQAIYQQKYKNIHFIQIEPEECQEKNYKNTSTLTIHKEICGWDKALYYFTHVNPRYEHVWFIEDDVFFHDEQTYFPCISELPNQPLQMTLFTKSKQQIQASDIIKMIF